MHQISLRDLNFSYDNPHQEVFGSLSMIISCEWKSALIGRNGRGKTTLLKLLTGEIKPTSGDISIPMTIKYFPYLPVNQDDITLNVIKDSIAPYRVWEMDMSLLLEKADEENLKEYSRILEIYTIHKGYSIDALIEKEISKIGLRPDILHQSFTTLSGGEKTRALIISLFLNEDAFPLLDEPTDHLDIKGRELLSEYLSESKKGFIVASHDRFLLDRCADHIISINKSNIEIIKGIYSTWRYQTDIIEQNEHNYFNNLEREAAHLKKASEQKRRWSAKKERTKNSEADSGFVSHKSAKLMKRALSIEKKIQDNLDEKKNLLKNKEYSITLRINQTKKGTERFISLNDLAVSFDGRNIFSGIYLNVFRGDRIAVIGRNGSGKSTLFNIIDGTIKEFRGNSFTAKNITIGRAFQYPLWQSGYLKDHLIKYNIDMTRFRFIMSAFNMKGDIFDHPLETFSRGMLRKIDLTRTLIINPDLLIWDEPLNYLDIESREQIEEFILANDLSVLFIEHDRTFVERCATEIFELPG